MPSSSLRLRCRPCHSAGRWRALELSRGMARRSRLECVYAYRSWKTEAQRPKNTNTRATSTLAPRPEARARLGVEEWKPSRVGGLAGLTVCVWRPESNPACYLGRCQEQDAPPVPIPTATRHTSGSLFMTQPRNNGFSDKFRKTGCYALVHYPTHRSVREGSLPRILCASSPRNPSKHKSL